MDVTTFRTQVCFLNRQATTEPEANLSTLLLYCCHILFDFCLISLTCLKYQCKSNATLTLQELLVDITVHVYRCTIILKSINKMDQSKTSSAGMTLQGLPCGAVEDEEFSPFNQQNFLCCSSNRVAAEV